MLIYKQRYKPRTTREFTKSDLTVYDSAGNTALNALTVYGKSEVVDGSIKSAGEGYAVVRLADLMWLSGYGGYYTNNTIGAQLAPTIADVVNAICSKYTTTSYSQSTNKTICGWTGGNCFLIKDDDYTTVSDFVASLGDATLCYQLADPTQDNCIAVKTDDSSGIDGTMAVFETGTPLRGIPNGARDVAEWYDTSGEVVKNCNEVDLGTLTWNYNDTRIAFNTPLSDISDGEIGKIKIMCAQYLATDTVQSTSAIPTKPNMSIFQQKDSKQIFIRNTAYTDATAFKNSLNGVKLIYELDTPTVQSLTSSENASIAGLRTFTPQTHAQNNAQTDMTVDYTIRVPTI